MSRMDHLQNQVDVLVKAIEELKKSNAQPSPPVVQTTDSTEYSFVDEPNETVVISRKWLNPNNCVNQNCECPKNHQR